MRLFKYLLLVFASILSVDVFADYFQIGTVKADTAAAVCTAYYGEGAYIQKATAANGSQYYRCYKKGGSSWEAITEVKEENKCPQKDTMSVFFFDKNATSVPQRRCINGCTYEYAGGPVTDYPDSKMVVLWATGDSINCTNTDSDTPNNNTPPCDFKDPYGGCYVPPDDKCIRLKDGSITCPETSPPPKNNTCNGATYCKRPPEGCGEGYVSGSFNGEQLCVRSGPNKPSNPPKPDDPQDPNNCMNGGSYCQQPPDNTSCPAGYTETTYNGSKICVKNNPDPEKPNPNDPNTDGGGGASEPTDGGGDGSTGGSINLKPVIDAINALKNALLNALSGISGKIDQLINGQKETNKKLDTSNEHLDKIEDSSKAASESLGDIKDATQATSEAIGESNKKLDSMKEAIEGQYKCSNENYDPNDKRSSKYRPCTEKDITGGSAEDTKVDVQEKSIDLDKDLRRDLFGGNSSCPPPLVIEFTFIDKVHLEFPYDLMCDGAALVRPWVILLGMLVSYFVITGQRSGGQD